MIEHFLWNAKVTAATRVKSRVTTIEKRKVRNQKSHAVEVRQKRSRCCIEERVHKLSEGRNSKKKTVVPAKAQDDRMADRESRKRCSGKIEREWDKPSALAR